MRAVQSPSPTRLQIMDVRPTIAAGDHPIDAVMAASEALSPDGLLEIVAPFEPLPLMKKLAARGFHIGSQRHSDAWIVQVAKRALPPTEDLTDLEPPEPLHRVLSAVSAIAPGAVYLARLPRTPAPLIAQLQARGIEYEVALRPDGSAVLWVRSQS